MDIHKRYAVVVGVNREQEVTLPSERIRMAQLPQWCADHLTERDAVVIEVTTNTWAVVDTLKAYAGKVVVAHPYKTKLIAEARIKNDKVDAHTLACLLAANFIIEVWIPSPQARHWRKLARHRGRLRRQCTQAKNRLQHLLQAHNLRNPEKSLFSAAGRAWLAQQHLPEAEQLIAQQLLDQIDFSAAQLKQCEQRIARLTQADARIARLMQITGVGLYTAFAIIAVLGDIRRFPSPNKLAGYVGLVPRQHQSGQRAYNGHITKTGDRLLRWLIVEAAQAAVRWDAHWHAVHQRIAQRRGYGIAVVAVARKLLVTIWHMLTEETNYHYLRRQSYVRKLQGWAYTIRHDHLPTDSVKAFVQEHLRQLGLHQLSEGLIADRKGKLCPASSAA
jgi:transposase